MQNSNRQRRIMYFLKPISALLGGLWSAFSLAVCPELSVYYKTSEADWEAAYTELNEIFDQCLLSSEYFALYGAAQLNIDMLPQAIESLERALLLDPENGSALVDYAEALLRDGQLFAAIEANEILLARQDVPNELRSEIQERLQNWSALVNQRSLQVDLLGGFDTNLNGAPAQEIVTLTLSGEPIFLALGDEYRAVQGPFLSTRLTGMNRRLTPDSQNEVFGQVRGRFSEDTRSDAIQILARYAQTSALNTGGRKWGVGLNHLLFEEKQVFTATDIQYRSQLSSFGGCTSYAGAALQHQIWHNRRLLDGTELKATIGATCNIAGDTDGQLSVEASALHNRALDKTRLGGDRDGWQINVQWQAPIFRGFVTAQAIYTGIRDRRGFNSLLSNNAKRQIGRGSVLMQYRRPASWLKDGAQFLLNIYHQDQQSNLELFETNDTTLEIGLGWQF